MTKQAKDGLISDGYVNQNIKAKIKLEKHLHLEHMCNHQQYCITIFLSLQTEDFTLQLKFLFPHDFQ